MAHQTPHRHLLQSPDRFVLPAHNPSLPTNRTALISWLAFAPLQTEQNISFPTWVNHRPSGSNSSEQWEQSCSCTPQDRRLTSLPGAAAQVCSSGEPRSAGGFTDSLKVSQLKQVQKLQGNKCFAERNGIASLRLCTELPQECGRQYQGRIFPTQPLFFPVNNPAFAALEALLFPQGFNPPAAPEG